jgi:hypothetical protein
MPRMIGLVARTEKEQSPNLLSTLMEGVAFATRGISLCSDRTTIHFVPPNINEV